MGSAAQRSDVTQQARSSRSPVLSRTPPGCNREARSPDDVQRTIGNQALQRLHHIKNDRREREANNTATRFDGQNSSVQSTQPRLTINPSGDRNEQQADRVAEQVMGNAESPFQRACSCANSSVAGECEACGKKKSLIDRSTGGLNQRSNRGFNQGHNDSSVAPPSVRRVLKSSGQPLDAGTRVFFESRFGYDFSQVRVHTDAQASESAHSVNAGAYTVGRDVVFASGRFAPHTEAGKFLLAHELTHVVQQSVAGSGLANGSGGSLALQRAPTFSNCKTKVKGKEDVQEKIIAQAIEDTKPLTQGALDALTTGMPSADSETRDAFAAHFGDIFDHDKVNAVVKVYQDIKKSLDSKDIACLPKCKSDKDGDICALAAPGKGISICPEFFRKPCADLQPAIILHESAHNAGAGGNTDKDRKKVSARKRKYPPKQAENNAYSFQHFAEDIRDRTFKVTNPSSGVEEVEVKPR